MNQTSGKTQWHTLLGAVLDALLSPIGIEVFTNIPVMSQPPEADILLLRREQAVWTQEQFNRLPDGIRESAASHILIEFKYTESLNADVLAQAIGYDYFYRKARTLKATHVQTVVVSAKSPRKRTLQQLGYEQTKHTGVYHNRFPVLDRITLLGLNELADTLHNAPIKCFASRKEEKHAAFECLHQRELPSFPVQFWWVIDGLWTLWFQRGDETMNIEFTPEQIAEMGKMWGRVYLSSLPVEERLAGLKPEERLKGLKPEEILAALKPEEILAALKPEERLTGLKPEERLIGLKPEERLRGLKPEEIERYLQKIKKKPSQKS